MAGQLKQVPASVYGPPSQDTSEDDLGRVRPHDAGQDQASIVTAWTGNLKDQYTPSNIYALYRRLTHVLDDAVHGGLRNRLAAFVSLLIAVPLTCRLG